MSKGFSNDCSRNKDNNFSTFATYFVHNANAEGNLNVWNQNNHLPYIVAFAIYKWQLNLTMMQNLKFNSLKTICTNLASILHLNLFV